MKNPFTVDELKLIFAKSKTMLEDEEKEHDFELRAIPPLTKQEVIDLIFNLVGLSADRPLTSQERFIHGQLLAQFEQAVTAEVLGYKGRYYVTSEDKIRETLKQKLEEN